MLKKIKSYYIIKNFLDLVIEKKKLQIAKYDNSLQKKMDISLINYINNKFFPNKI